MVDRTDPRPAILISGATRRHGRTSVPKWNGATPTTTSSSKVTCVGGSVKRVASGVGAGAIAVQQVHQYLSENHDRR